MAKAKKKTKKKKRQPPNPQVVAQRKQKRLVRSFFANLDFERIKSDGIEFTFKNRTGELDDIFVFENIVVVAEYTIGDATSAHIAKKSILYNAIHQNQAEWISFSSTTFPGFSATSAISTYKPSDCKVCLCYFSTQGASDQIEQAFKYVHFLDGTKFRYFNALSKTIHKSSRHEVFKYFGLEFKEIGAEVKNSSNSTKTFIGFVLPESYSSFPTGFKVVSFYADPNTLLTMSYVLRRDSWRDEEGMYQRVLQRGRMNQMRKYLTTEERVFVNNIIVTLPHDTKLNNPKDPGSNLDLKSLTHVESVAVAVPFRSNVIGIVDGQHRVFCYHEGSDKYEGKIKQIRDRQNLLVTGIVYPIAYSDVEKRRFEAKLFLEINDKQKRTGSELKQSIELILNPYSTVAIAKSVVHRLNNNGALKGMLQTNYFDPPNLIRTTSIVSYGLRPLLKLDGKDSLFTAWQVTSKEKLRELQKGQSDPSKQDPILESYILYCVEKVNDLLIAAKKADGPGKWKITEKAKDRHLSPTIINGLIVCLRLLVENGKVFSLATYEKKLNGLGSFPFDQYKSSHWKALGSAIYSKYF